MQTSDKKNNQLCIILLNPVAHLTSQTDIQDALTTPAAAARSCASLQVGRRDQRARRGAVLKKKKKKHTLARRPIGCVNSEKSGLSRPIVAPSVRFICGWQHTDRGRERDRVRRARRAEERRVQVSATSVVAACEARMHMHPLSVAPRCDLQR